MTGKQPWRSYYERFREKCFDLLGRECVMCGGTENLEIDHRDWRVKTIEITRAQAPARWEEVKRELGKCQVLCRNCHRLKSKEDLAERKQRPEVHGTIYRYMRYKCRCDACTAANAEYKRGWRIAHGITSGLRKNGNPTCGTSRGYSAGCRCGACRAANAERMREFRAGLQAG